MHDVVHTTVGLSIERSHYHLASLYIHSYALTMLEIASIALTAFLTLSSNPLLLFNLITLPLLIHLSTTSTTPGAFVASAVPILATASTLRSLPTIHGLISSFFQAFLVQAAFSIAISIFVVLPITLTKLATSKIATLSHGQAAVVFGLLWAVAWLIWEGISPLGRYVSLAACGEVADDRVFRARCPMSLRYFTSSGLPGRPASTLCWELSLTLSFDWVPA